MNFRNLDLNLLKVFDAVMAEHSLTRAAARLAMTQPAVSHALKRLREALGEELFVRHAFGMKPTLRAEAMWPEVRLILQRLQALLAPEHFRPEAEEFTFRIAMADATAALLLPPLVAQLEEGLALANVHVVPLTTRDPRALLDQGEADFAVGYFPAAVAALLFTTPLWGARAVAAPFFMPRLFRDFVVAPLAPLPLPLPKPPLPLPPPAAPCPHPTPAAAPPGSCAATKLSACACEAA